jgi:hypothetical protein
MATTLRVVCKEFRDYAFACNLNATLLFGECGAKVIVLICRWTPRVRGSWSDEPGQIVGLTSAKAEQSDYYACESNLLHVHRTS